MSTPNPPPKVIPIPLTGRKLQLVDELPILWRSWSVRAMALAGSLEGLWLIPGVQDYVKTLVSAEHFHAITAAITLIGIVLRALKQNSMSAP